ASSRNRSQRGPKRHVAEEHSENRTRISEKKVREQARPFVDVLPREQDEILAQDGLDLGFAEVLADGAAVLVVDDAARLIEHLPAALPGQESEVGVFQVKRMQQWIEAAKFQELFAIEGARAAATVEARERIDD